ncbi:Coumaroyl-CoA:anthocyanidin 3-O-glucoside-6''-O-coumaroyltransferase 1 [Spatholobus suberectus]|nr:Coumaroyl-CoA:anthocyanidin 3-O-glucoside-6''-O-coumaroyltransferase 1 [Spatholobus suberectus]
MAHPIDHGHNVKIIEQCKVSPPPSSVPSTSLPLTFFDIPWVNCGPVQSIFFYEFPYSSNHFLQTVLPTLKHSLSLTLQHFFPFAGNLVFPFQPHFPYILYSEGDSLFFTVAESTIEFPCLIGDTARDVRDLHPSVPVLPTPGTKEDGTCSSPLMAIQVTIFPNYGFSICMTFRHVIADGRAFLHFMKYWSYVCRTRSDLASLEGSQASPLHNRDIIEDHKGLKLIFLEELWNLPTEGIKKLADPIPNVINNNEKVRVVFMLNSDHVEKLKKLVSSECKSYGFESLHISTFVVTCSLMWVCKVQSEEASARTIPKNDEIYKLAFLADCRNRLQFSIPSTYFGNCIVGHMVSHKRSKLVGGNGIVEAAIAIGRKVRDFQFDALRGVEGFMADGKEIEQSGEHVITIAGSPKMGAYEIDFGWGKPKKCEILHIEYSGTISLSDCRDDEGGVEVELVLGRVQMSNFSTILEDYLRNLLVVT